MRKRTGQPQPEPRHHPMHGRGQTQQAAFKDVVVGFSILFIIGAAIATVLH